LRCSAGNRQSSGKTRQWQGAQSSRQDSSRQLVSLTVSSFPHPLPRELQNTFSATAKACIQISKMVSRAQTDDIYGVATDESGEMLDENVQVRRASVKNTVLQQNYSRLGQCPRTAMRARFETRYSLVNCAFWRSSLANGVRAALRETPPRLFTHTLSLLLHSLRSCRERCSRSWMLFATRSC